MIFTTVSFLTNQLTYQLHSNSFAIVSKFIENHTMK